MYMLSEQGYARLCFLFLAIVVEGCQCFFVNVILGIKFIFVIMIVRGCHGLYPMKKGGKLVLKKRLTRPEINSYKPFFGI